MKTLLVSVNSQYIHSNLAVWYLKSACDKSGIDTAVMEFSINQQIENVYMEIVMQNPQIICFSVYIWNISFILKLAQDIKKVLPGITIILGGPEVTYNSKNILKENDQIDFCICGAGEKAVVSLIREIKSGGSDFDIDGVNYNNNAGFVDNGTAYVEFDKTSSPYTLEMLEFCSGKIFYYESSRGCPFKCGYCLSSCEDGVMYLPLDRVFSELDTIVKAGYKLIKFVDRTFNANAKRSYEIVKFIIENTGDTTFHFEIGADLLTDELVELLSTAPNGKIQLEAGIQTTNPKTLDAIDRKTDLDKLFKRVRQLVSGKNIHIHIDLIAGLPFEDYDSFAKSFNDVYSLKADELQLGFLKLLHGTKLRNQSSEYGYMFRHYHPYEFLQSDWLDYADVVKIKRFGRIFELFGNGGKFILTLGYLEQFFENPFSMFEKMSQYFDLDDRPFSLVNKFGLMIGFVRDNFDEDIFGICKELLRFDFRRGAVQGEMPKEIVGGEGNFMRLKREFDELGMGDLTGLDTVSKQNRWLKLEEFVIDPVSLERKRTVVAFDYGTKSKVTGLCKYYKCEK